MNQIEQKTTKEIMRDHKQPLEKGWVARIDLIKRLEEIESRGVEIDSSYIKELRLELTP